MNALTLDGLCRSESLSKVDKAQLVKSYVSSQLEYRKLHVTEGKKTRDFWDLPTPSTPKLVATDPVNAGFDTPILKARMPDSQSASHVGHPTDKQPAAGPPLLPPEQRKSKKRKKADVSAIAMDKATGTVHRVRSSQKTLEECITSSKDSTKEVLKKGKKRVRSSDSEHEARLSKRRDRRRAKKAIVEPRQQPSEQGGDTQASETPKQKGKAKKAKNKGLNVAAGLALMHGFSAPNVGSSRLTLKPSFGVFQRGKASANTETQKKQKTVTKQWSEDIFLGRGDKPKTQRRAKSSSSNSSNDGPDAGIEIVADAKAKYTSQTPSKPSSKHTHKVRTAKSDNDSDDLSTGCPLESKRQRTESIVWDIEQEDRKLSPPPKATALPSPQQDNGSIVLDTRAVQWNAGTPTKSFHKSSDVSGGPLFDRLKSHRSNTPVPKNGLLNSRPPSSSLAPSQSASQVIRSSSELTSGSRPAPLLHRSKYFPSPSPMKPSIIVITQSSTIGGPSRSDKRQATAEVAPRSRDTMSNIQHREHEALAPLYPVTINSDYSSSSSNYNQNAFTAFPNTAELYHDDMVTEDDDFTFMQLPYTTSNSESPMRPSESLPNLAYTADYDFNDPGPGYARSADLTLDSMNPEMEASFDDGSLMDQAVIEDWDDYPGMHSDFLARDSTYLVDYVTSDPHEEIACSSFPITPEVDETESILDSDSQQNIQDQSLYSYDVDEWSTSPSGRNDMCQNQYPTVSRVEEDVAKQLQGHWRPQRL